MIARSGIVRIIRTTDRMGEGRTTMTEPAAGDQRLMVKVATTSGSDDEEVAELSRLLTEELLMLDITSAEPVTEETGPAAAKSGLAAVGGWIVVNLGPVALKTLIGRVLEWSAHATRSVELSIDGDVLKVAGIDRVQQERLIDEWIARQAARA